MAEQTVLVSMIPYGTVHLGAICALRASYSETLGDLLERLRPLPGLERCRLEVGKFRPRSLVQDPKAPYWSRSMTVGDYLANVGFDAALGPGKTSMIFCTPPG